MRRRRAEEVGDDVGDVAAVIVAGARPLLDLDAAAGAEPVDDVVRIVAPVPLVGQSDPDIEPAGSTCWMACLSRSFTSAGAVPPMSTPGSSLKPWKATAWAKRRDITESSSGKHTGLRSVEVMCQRSKAPPSGLQPLARQTLASCGPRRSATRSACSSVCSSMSPPWGAMAMRCVWEPSSSSRSTSSPASLAFVSHRSGSTTLVSSTPSNSSVRLEPLPAAGPHAHDRVRRLVQQLAHRVERELVVVVDPHLLAKPAPERRERSRRGGAVLAVVLEILLGVDRLLDRRRCVAMAHSLLPPRLAIHEPRDRLEIPGGPAGFSSPRPVKFRHF